MNGGGVGPESIPSPAFGAMWDQDQDQQWDQQQRGKDEEADPFSFQGTQEQEEQEENHLDDDDDDDDDAYFSSYSAEFGVVEDDGNVKEEGRMYKPILVIHSVWSRTMVNVNEIPKLT